MYIMYMSYLHRMHAEEYRYDISECHLKPGAGLVREAFAYVDPGAPPSEHEAVKSLTLIRWRFVPKVGQQGF